MGREKIHDKIDDLLGQLSINNSRLSLHTERISQLDIDVLRKQCIELYDQVNRLALTGRQVTPQPVIREPEPPSKPVQAEKPVPPAPQPEPEEIKPKKAKPVSDPMPESKAKKAPVVEEEEMLSLFEKFNSKPIASIPKAISVAKRFEFQSNFFDGEAKDYKEFMTRIDTAEDREAAFAIYHEYKERLQWENEELKDELKALMYRKYQ